MQIYVICTLPGTTAVVGEGGGGGIYNYSTDMTIDNSNILGNSTEISGGGIANGGDLTIVNSTVSNNETITTIWGISDADLVNFDLGTMNIINSTIAG